MAATTKEFPSTQSTTYFNALVAAEMNSPEVALKIILSSLRAGMDASLAAEVEKAMEALRENLKS